MPSTKHRNPPRPRFWWVGRGRCRFCGEETAPRKHWHDACAKLWRIANWPSEARHFLWRRDRGVCAHCGKEAGVSGWHADHIVPLFRAPRQLRYWLPQNLQTLCLDCHKTKSRMERGG